jgi:hypothetical protein
MAKRPNVIITVEGGRERERENMQTDRCGKINGQKCHTHTHKGAEKNVNTRVNV